VFFVTYRNCFDPRTLEPRDAALGLAALGGWQDPVLEAESDPRARERR